MYRQNLQYLASDEKLSGMQKIYLYTQENITYNEKNQSKLIQKSHR